MAQIASRGNFIVTWIFARPIDRTTFCQSGNQMPESTIDSRETTRPRIWKRSQPDQYSALARHQRLSILMDISKCATTLSIFFLSYVWLCAASSPRIGSYIFPVVPTYAHGTPRIVDEECQGKRHHSQGLSYSLNNRYRTALSRWMIAFERRERRKLGLARTRSVEKNRGVKLGSIDEQITVLLKIIC